MIGKIPGGEIGLRRGVPLAGPLVHLSGENPASPRLEDGDEFVGLRVAVVLCGFVVAEFSFVRFFGEEFDALLQFIIAMKVRNLRGLFATENPQNGIGSAVKCSGVND